MPARHLSRERRVEATRLVRLQRILSPSKTPSTSGLAEVEATTMSLEAQGRKIIRWSRAMPWRPNPTPRSRWWIWHPRIRTLLVHLYLAKSLPRVNPNSVPAMASKRQRDVEGQKGACTVRIQCSRTRNMRAIMITLRHRRTPGITELRHRSMRSRPKGRYRTRQQTSTGELEAITRESLRRCCIHRATRTTSHRLLHPHQPTRRPAHQDGLLNLEYLSAPVG